MSEPENLVLALLREMRAEMARGFAEVRAEVADVRSELRSDFRSEIHSLRADVASDLMTLEKRLTEQGKHLGEQIAGLRRQVTDYHLAVAGHGALLTEFEERLRRVERHVGLGPETEPH